MKLGCEQIEQLVEQYSDMIYRVAYSQLGSDAAAADVVSDVLLKIITLEKGFKSEQHKKAWLIRVTVNRCRDIFRAQKNIAAEEMPEQAADFAPLDEKLDIAAAMEQMPPKLRTVLYLYYYEEYGTREIAKMLGIPKSTVTTSLSRARKMLKNKLNGYGG